MKNGIKTSSCTYHLGDTLRTVRERRKMTMRALASAIGVSESLISQIERDKISPSLDTLLAIVDVLEIDIEYLFKNYKKSKSVHIVRCNERNKHIIDEVTYEQLSKLTDGKPEFAIEALLITLPPETSKGNTEYGHQGSELGFILEGSAELRYGKETYRINEGDSISFSADIPHILNNTGKKHLRALWIITPPRMFLLPEK